MYYTYHKLYSFFVYNNNITYHFYIIFIINLIKCAILNMSFKDFEKIEVDFLEYLLVDLHIRRINRYLNQVVTVTNI